MESKAAGDLDLRGAPSGPERGDEEYCRFGKRNLDGMSWLYPLLNNRIGDLLNLELRHEHLFFIEGDRILDNIGYSEKGCRFREEDYGKKLSCVADLRANGYWLAGRIYDPPCMREALEQVDDGAYYSILSNQCQDWTDRLKQEALRVERERGIRPPSVPGASTLAVRDRLPAAASGTAPAAWYLGLITLAVGVLAVLAPVVTAHLYLRFLGLLLAVMGLSDIHYAWRAAPRPGLPAAVLIGILKVAFGVCLLLADLAVFQWAWALPGAALLVIGLFKLFQAATSRPRNAWFGTAAAGILGVAAGAFILASGPGTDARLIGWLLGLALVASGASTIVLDWRLQRPARAPLPD